MVDGPGPVSSSSPAGRRADTMAGGKVQPLSVAIRRLVLPGSTVHLAYSGGRPVAATAEIARRFFGESPNLTVSAHGFVGPQLALVELGLVSRLITAFAGDNCPMPAPSPILRRGQAAGLEVSNWTIWSLTARLMAGALGVPFMPVRSLLGSSLATEHDGSDFQLVRAFEQPDVGVVRALRPDVTIVQAAVGDAEGNVRLSPPFGESLWGALAAKRGVIACVEKIVPPGEIAESAETPHLPKHVVQAVCEVPLGSHPYGQAANHRGVELGYDEDVPFALEARLASRTAKTYREWMDRWILSVADPRDYVDRLGEARVQGLRGGETSCGTAPTVRDPQAPASGAELAILAAAELIRRRVREDAFDYVLAGIGISHLAAWIAHEQLVEEGSEVQLLAENGMVGYRPSGGSPYLFATSNVKSSDVLTDVANVLGTLVAGPASKTLGILGAGQVDQQGNVNSTISSTGAFITGSGGGNDVASAADEIILTLKHREERLPVHLPYRTSIGDRVSAIVTSRCIFERVDDGTFELTGYFGTVDQERQILADIASMTGWDVTVSADVVALPPPDPAVLERLRSFDPGRLLLRD